MSAVVLDRPAAWAASAGSPSAGGTSPAAPRSHPRGASTLRPAPASVTVAGGPGAVVPDPATVPTTAATATATAAGTATARRRRPGLAGRRAIAARPLRAG